MVSCFITMCICKAAYSDSPRLEMLPRPQAVSDLTVKKRTHLHGCVRNCFHLDITSHSFAGNLLKRSSLSLADGYQRPQVRSSPAVQMPGLQGGEHLPCGYFHGSGLVGKPRTCIVTIGSFGSLSLSELKEISSSCLALSPASRFAIL